MRRTAAGALGALSALALSLFVPCASEPTSFSIHAPAHTREATEALCASLPGCAAVRRVGSLAGFWTLDFSEGLSPAQRARRDAATLGSLSSSAGVLWVQRERELSRVRRGTAGDASSTPSDPKFPGQWYLQEGQLGAVSQLNQQRVWELGFTGRGVVITVVDDG